MRLKSAKGFNNNTYYRTDWLLSKYPDTKFIYVNGDYIAIINPPSNFNNLRQVTVQVDEKIPLWKQSMQISIGRRPESTKSSFRNMTFQKIDGVAIYHYCYKVYECF